MNYFITGLLESSRLRLDAGRVVFIEHQVRWPALSKLVRNESIAKYLPTEKGLVLDEANFIRACEVLGAQLDGTPVQVQPGLFQVKLKYCARKSAVALLAESAKTELGLETPLLDAIHRILVPVLTRDVTLHDERGKPVEPKEDGGYHIHLYSSPDPAAKKGVSPNYLFGLPLAWRGESFLLSALGTPLADDDGKIVGEILRSHFYFHHNIMAVGNAAEWSIFARYCEEISAFLTMPEDERRVRSEQLTAQAEERRRNHYLQLCTKRLDQQIHETESEIAEHRRNTLELEVSLRNAIRSRRDAEHKCEALKARRNTDYPRLLEEYLRIKADPKVIGIEPQDGALRVWTDTLYCRNRQTKMYHEIGRMLIEIFPDGAAGSLRIYNLTRQCKGADNRMPHPHIRGDGSLCYGDTQIRFNELIAAYELAAVVFLAIQFVESVNPHDIWGKHISNWPVVPESAVEKLRADGKL